MHASTYIQKIPHIHKDIYIQHKPAYTHTHTSIYRCMNIHTTHIQINTHIHRHACIYNHTHTYTHSINSHIPHTYTHNIHAHTHIHTDSHIYAI